jgi:hypothetical protein
MTLEDEITEIKKKLDNFEKRISTLEAYMPKKPEALKKLSIKEFLLSKKPKSDVQKTLVIGYYLEKHEGYSSFNAADIEEGFGSAKETVPKNINLCIIRNVQKGHLAEAKEEKNSHKAWYLTNTGEIFVENNFAKDK